MITSFQIKNFRTCHDISLSGARHSTLLIGRNGAGKTNILSALEWMSTVAISPNGTSIVPFLEGSSVSVNLTLSGRTFRYLVEGGAPRKSVSGRLLISELYAEKLVEIGVRGAEKLIFERVAGTIAIVDGRKRQLLTVPPSLVSTFDLAISAVTNEKTLSSIKIVHDFLSGVRYYALDDLRGDSIYIRRNQYADWLQGGSEKEDVAGGEVVLYRLIRLHEERKELFDEIVAILGEDELDIIKNIKIGISTLRAPEKGSNKSKDNNVIGDFFSKELNSFYTVQFFVPGAEKSVVHYQGLSFGTRRILQLIVALLYDRSTVMLVEQPEDGIHPGLLGKLMRVIHGYASPTQFFMTSHSPSVINSVPAEDIRIVMNVIGRTQCRALTKDEIQGAGEFINEEGQLAEFVRLLEQ